MVLLQNEEFLTELAKMFLNARPSGSVLMTIKKYDGRTKPVPRDGKIDKSDIEYKCLIRATHKNKKLSTVVEKSEASRFQSAYANLLRGNFALTKLKKPKIKSKATL